ESSNTNKEEEFNVEQVNFNPNESLTLEDYKNKQEHTAINQLTEKATTEATAFEKNIENIEIDSTVTLMTEVMKKSPKRYMMEDEYKSIVSDIVLPQFFKKVGDEIGDGILF